MNTLAAIILAVMVTMNAIAGGWMYGALCAIFSCIAVIISNTIDGNHSGK